MSAATAEVLRKARALVERGWTQGAFARHDDGTATPNWAQASEWCGSGACFVAGGNPRDGAPATRALCRVVGAEHGRFSEWNDTPGRTQAEVLDAFDRAIAAEERTP